MHTGQRDDQRNADPHPRESVIHTAENLARWVALPAASLYANSALAHLAGRPERAIVAVPGFGTVIFVAALSWPFTARGEGDDGWQGLLDDGEPYCKRRVLENSSDEALTFEIMWDQPDAEDPDIEQWDPRPIRVPPRSQTIVECAIRKIRVRGPRGARGCVHEHESDDKPGTVRITGSGIAVRTGPTLGTVNCRKYAIANDGPDDVEVKLVRAAKEGGVDTETTTRLAAGNTLVVRCRFMEISILAPDGARTSVTPLE